MEQNLLESFPYWYWMAFGATLIIFEIFVPSTLLLWPGVAALMVGFISLVFPGISEAALLLIWGVISLSLLLGWLAYRKKNPKPGGDSTINRRGAQIVGRHFTLLKDIMNGTGELHIDDTRWKVISSHDLPAGTKVKVIAVEGTSLRVEEYIS